MLIAPIPLGDKTLERATLEQDKKACRRFGPCGVGAQALYIGGRFMERRFYLPWREVKRVFKRVAMSKGGFTGKGVFGSMAFLVVQYGKGKEKECPFKREEDLDALLKAVEEQQPRIPTHSAAAERKLSAAREKEEAATLKTLSPAAEDAVALLERCVKFLELRPSLYRELTGAAQQKRVADNMKPGYRIGGIVMLTLSILSALYGAWGWWQKTPNAVYFLLGGAVFFMFTLATSMLPSRYNSKKYSQKRWDEAVAACQANLKGRPDFPLPPQYAHPMVLQRMLRSLKTGRCETVEEAYALVKSDLKALNSSVTVTPKEYDEVVAIKPMFLVCEYQDEI